MLTPKALANFSVVLNADRRWQISAWFLTPEAFANFSPVVGAQRQPWVRNDKTY